MSTNVYHVTPRANLASIYKHGLIPQIGIRSEALGETKEAVYCFPRRDDCDSALMNWLGEAFEEYEEEIGEEIDLAILEICLPDGAITESEVEYEIAVLHKIEPANIVNCFDEAWEEDAIYGKSVVEISMNEKDGVHELHGWPKLEERTLAL